MSKIFNAIGRAADTTKRVVVSKRAVASNAFNKAVGVLELGAGFFFGLLTILATTARAPTWASVLLTGLTAFTIGAGIKNLQRPETLKDDPVPVESPALVSPPAP